MSSPTVENKFPSEHIILFIFFKEGNKDLCCEKHKGRPPEDGMLLCHPTSISKHSIVI